MLKVRGVYKYFGGLAANANLNFDVQRGTILALVGPNGAGKTTLFNCITGHEPPTKGEVTLNGIRLNGKRPDAICRMGLVRTWQKVRPLAQMTVLDNVIVGALLRNHSLRLARKHAMKQLEIVRLAHRAGTVAKSIPIGERKKLEIARLLATDPQVILFDEVMGGLTPVEREDTIQLMFDLKARGLTQVVVEHDMRAIMRISDHIVVLRSGQMLAEGTPTEIVNNQTVVAAYLGEGDNA